MSTRISWTDETWNPVTGCNQVSPGCDNCYALRMAKRLKAMGNPRYQADGDPRTSGPGFGVAIHPDLLDVPLRWRKPRRVFVNSMSDLFHPRVPDEFIAEVFGVMAATPQHTYQVLTKRPKRARALLSAGPFDARVWAAWERLSSRSGWGGWPLPNVWLGTSVEDQQRAEQRIPVLLDTPAAVRFLSCEPLIAPVDLWPFVTPAHHPAPGGPIGWVIVGGESGPGHRRMELDWARQIVTDCHAAGVAVHVKQLGAAHGRAHHDIDTFPEYLQVREWPEVAA